MEFFDLSRQKIINLLMLAALTAGCSQLDAFVDRRREAGAKTPESLYVGASTPEAPAVCYNSLLTPYKRVKELADQECVRQNTGTHAEPVRQTLFTCRLLVPNHYYFKCEK